MEVKALFSFLDLILPHFVCSVKYALFYYPVTFRLLLINKKINLRKFFLDLF